jgi:hypothetical protein
VAEAVCKVTGVKHSTSTAWQREDLGDGRAGRQRAALRLFGSQEVLCYTFIDIADGARALRGFLNLGKEHMGKLVMVAASRCGTAEVSDPGETNTVDVSPTRPLTDVKP